MGKWLGPEGSDCGIVNVRSSLKLPDGATELSGPYQKVNS
jgi:hypothetical protein